MRLRDQLPRRISDPLFLVRNHVARRSGADDPIRERRKRREAERQPRLDPGLPSEIVDLVGHTHTLPITITRVVTNGLVVAAGGTNVFTILCTAGSVAIGGGWLSDTSIINVFESYPFSTTQWRVSIQNPDVSIATNSVWAICLKTTTG